jgi:hypothetical protein
MTQPVIARFQFDPADAAHFLEGGREVIEMQFDTVDEIIEYCREFEDAIVDCTANINGRIISLADQPEEE